MIFEQMLPIKAQRWYQTVWGILLLGVGIVIVVVVVAFLILLGKYWNEIKTGKVVQLPSAVYGGFSTATVSDPSGGAATRADIETSDDPFLGNPDADVVIVEFVDFKCPNCKAELPIMKQVLQKYGHRIKWIVRDFPVESTHPGASQAAEIINCASEQGLYWVAHDWFYNNQDNLVQALAGDEINIVADLIGLDYKKLVTCLGNSTIRAEVNRDFADGYKAGVAGTPTFFINGYKVEGVVPFEAWDKFLSVQ
ncbi:MAG: hypothetical protein A2538_02945 [Candidatus Magasanikbacteria bacterium RIFOXYD2_FULL_41_14]|uniref:Thioredoxin domain-containing protein n=1 Tax=Candidatus Magasanikbacteria bacterium RIFOXYD2_FULL_41_14 TaxID=1798709 RepID=A0A1F6PCB1_9BACT|nr:MAG: hypothetical protein A2538_02945 [Candidatus Magasanikbacteria bacterium RIFOXYD2_FULL_41_14]